MAPDEGVDREDEDVRVVIGGGGTGGHLTPAVALARELISREPPADVTLVGGVRGLDREVLSLSGLSYRLIATPAVERRRWWKNVILPAALARSVGRALGILKELRPDVVVGTGGYVMVPVVTAAALTRRPILLQEQNRTPGLATRALSRWADRICVQFRESERFLGKRAAIEVTGSPIPVPEPVRSDFEDRLDPALPTVGVVGGSQGARSLNTALEGLLQDDPDAAPFNLVWQTGKADFDRVVGKAGWPERFVIRGFFDPMAAVYPRLDLIVCRSGAMTVAEITAWGIPSILVPFPHATADHQTANALALESEGAAIVIRESELSSRRLGNLVTGLLRAPERRLEMATAAKRMGRPRAATQVADRVMELARRGS